VQGNYNDALASLQTIVEIGEPYQERGKASFWLLWVMYHIALGKRAATRSDSSEVIQQLSKALEFIAETRRLTLQSPFVSKQYQMALECQAVLAHLGFAQTNTGRQIHQKHLALALKASETANDIYQEFGFAQIIECVSEEVFFRHSQALSANGKHDLALSYLQRAYDEMMTKMEMIPPDSDFRRSFLEHIPLHQEIRAAFAIRSEMLTYTAENTVS
jgi:tetratricopeptide (TPR) repeat protein